jgi:hypothetical protein
MRTLGGRVDSRQLKVERRAAESPHSFAKARMDAENGGTRIVLVRLMSDLKVRPLKKAVGAGAEEFEEAQISKDLELLADFVGDVGVFGVQFG